MLKRIWLAGFSTGVALGCAYGWAGPSGCGTALGTIPLLFAWLVVAKLLGSIFADQHHWPPIVIAAFAHGLFLAFLCWVADLAIRRFVSDEATVRLTGFALLVTLFAGLLFFAWPLEDCP
jgi:phosphoglycerol transferase MdoB-like AlkP superfamily enzyme